MQLGQAWTLWRPSNGPTFRAADVTATDRPAERENIGRERDSHLEISQILPLNFFDIKSNNNNINLLYAPDFGSNLNSADSDLFGQIVTFENS